MRIRGTKDKIQATVQGVYVSGSTSKCATDRQYLRRPAALPDILNGEHFLSDKQDRLKATARDVLSD